MNPRLLAVLSLFAVACSGSTPPAGDTGVVADAPADTGTDSGCDTPAEVDGEVGISDAIGSIALETHALRTSKDAMLRGYTLRTSFARRTGDHCTKLEVAGCVLRTCDGPLPTIEWITAGTVAVAKEPTSAPFPLITAPDGSSRYPERTGAATLFRGGDRVTVTATGSPDLAPFTQSATAPALIWVDAPPIDGTAHLTVSRTKALTIVFHPQADNASVGTAEAEFYSLTEARYLTCSAPIANGEIVVPSAALSRMPIGEGGVYVLTASRESIASAPGIALALVTTAGAAIAGPAEASVTFE